MKGQIKAIARATLPVRARDALRHAIQNAPRFLERRLTQRIFNSSTMQPVYLETWQLDALLQKYTFPPRYGYNAQAVDARGKDRAAALLRFPQMREATSTLELGCFDGMVSCHLARAGKRATAIDHRDTGFDSRAVRESVSLRQMDASRLEFADRSFDFVFSYDSFEHFSSPEEAFVEAARVLRPGGHLYLDFGPLYYSPLGEHAYDSVPIPYCQFLFKQETINAAALRSEKPLIDFGHVNGWSIQRYRDLWSKYAHVLRKVRYYENVDLSHLDLIRAYPSCFKSKSSCFENFVVDYVRAMFQKTPY